MRSTNFDIVFYGATSGAVVGAYEAARQGLSAAIVGGWRERHLGGMMSGGLGGTDLHGLSRLSGLALTVLGRISAAAGLPPTSAKFEPRHAEQVFKDMTAEAGTPVFWSDGVETVTRQGRRIVSFRTVDGQSFQARYFADCGYEGDLMARAGVSYTVGREAADADNRLNGFRGRSLAARGGGHNWRRAASAVSPHVVPGDPESGLLPGVRPWPKTARGAADDQVQAYGFRLILTADPERRVPFPETPPEGFDPIAYELLFRYCAALRDGGLEYGRDYSWNSRFFLAKRLRSSVYDVNNRGPFSLDFIGGSEGYPDADYAGRERIWKAHERYTRGLIYALQHHPDDRVPRGLRAAMLNLGLDRLHFTEPLAQDQPHWPYQLYVREARRMVSDVVWNASDLDPASGRCLRPIANGAYRRDSHHGRRYALPARKGPRHRLWNEGNFERRVPGNRFSAPYDIIIPARAEVENLFVAFCVSATHEAFGGLRMEPTLMGVGQAIGAATAAAIAAGGVAVQDVDYADLRARLRHPDDPVPFKPCETALAA